MDRLTLDARLFLTLLLLCAGCAGRESPASLTGIDGARRSFGDVAHGAPWTVLVFVSSTCPCMAAHRDRLEELVATYRPRGVQVVAVESEVGTTPASLAAEAREYSATLLADEGARLANQLGAEYATYTVIVDAEGHIRYRGGLDSDKLTIHGDATLFVRDALDDLLAGKPVRRAEGKTLGCVLRKW